MRGVGVALAMGMALVTASEASARQSGYVYLECDLQVGGGAGKQAYRIGNGQWDFLANPDWEALEWVDCGGQRQRGSLLYVRTCTFSDREFRSDIRVTAPEMPGWSTLTVHQINRYTGVMTFAFLASNGVGNRSASGNCRSIPEPKPERKF